MTDKNTYSKSKLVLEAENCCVSDIGLPGFAECQRSGPNPCPYAVPFGYSFLCQHPHLEQAMAKIKDGKASAV
ncbi:MAG TPA: hypothetical protein VLX61_15910 [Anaerolineales bacterium]|nr:hypothetical protein [Anaerolineales bacterium]